MNCVRYIEYLQCPKRKFSGGTRNFNIVSLITSKMVPVLYNLTLFVSNASIAAVAGLIKRHARLTVINIAQSVGISSGQYIRF